MNNLALVLLFFILGFSSFAFPEAPYDALKSGIIPPFHLDSDDYNFEGIVKLSNCSGSIIRFKGQSIDSNAVVLTNGHCLGRPFLKQGEVVYKKTIRRRMKVADKNKRFHNVKAIELIYGTMTDTDSALYRLKETFRDLEKLGIVAFELDDIRPQQGMPIEIISGYWERGYRCEIDDFVYRLQEDSWLFKDSIRYTSQGCRTIGGTSGSPIIMSGSRIVIGVNNTANESGKECTMNNPCEVDEDNFVIVRKGASYGQQTYQFYTCLDSQSEIDLTLDGCKLPK